MSLTVCLRASPVLQRLRWLTSGIFEEFHVFVYFLESWCPQSAVVYFRLELSLSVIQLPYLIFFSFFFFFNSNLGMPWMRGLKPHVLPSCTTAFPRDNQASTKSNHQTQSGRWKIAGLFTCTIFRRVWPRWFLDKKKKKKSPETFETR